MHTHTDQSQCRGSHPIGTSLGGGVVGHWAPLPGTQLGTDNVNSDRPPKACNCGCNVYSGTSPVGPTDVDQLDIPALPLILDYEDDDGPSDDHEYVSIKITELSDMVSAIRSCTCQDH